MNKKIQHYQHIKNLSGHFNSNNKCQLYIHLNGKFVLKTKQKPQIKQPLAEEN
ncbi:hypothetical protein Hanom_Chr12g01153371 [Helianthus anomalus]